MGFTGEKNRRHDNAAYPVEKPDFTGNKTWQELRAKVKPVDMATFR